MSDVVADDDLLGVDGEALIFISYPSDVRAMFRRCDVPGLWNTPLGVCCNGLVSDLYCLRKIEELEALEPQGSC